MTDDLLAMVLAERPTRRSGPAPSGSSRS